MYERQHGGDMEVGSYAHRRSSCDPDEIPSIEQSALSPTELPFTQDDFDPQLQDALELMPESSVTRKSASVMPSTDHLDDPRRLSRLGETPR